MTMDLQICVFSKHLSWLPVPEMAEAVRETGFDGVDLAVRPGGHVEPDRVETDLPKAVEAITKTGLSCPMMVSGIHDPDDPTTETVIRTAAACGIRYYRMAYLPYGESIRESLSEHRRTLSRLWELNEKHGIHGAYQNHAGTRLGGPVWDIWELLRDLDPKWLGCQYDVRHAVVEGATSWELGMRLLADWIRCIAVKDAKWSEPSPGAFETTNTPIGSGMVDWDRFLKILPTTSFEGAVSIHYEYPLIEGPPEELPTKDAAAKTIEAMKPDLDRVRKMLGGTTG